MKKLLLSLVMLMPLIAFGATDVVFDFTTNGFELPTSKDQNTKATRFSNQAGQSITTLNCYYNKSGEAVLIQTGAGNYIKFAPFSAPVTKITITSGKQCAAKATVILKAGDTAIQYGEGDAAATEVNLNEKSKDFVWNVPADLQAAGTVFTIENANANNVQIGKVIFTIDANYVDLWLRGYKTWDATDENKLNTTDGVHYTLENVVLRTGSKFKIADATWGANNYGSASDVVAGQEYTLESGSGSGDITIAEEMVATVNFNLDTKVLSLTKTGNVPEPVITYAIHGALEDEWKDYPLTEDEGLWATVVKVTKEPNGEFGLKKYIDGSQAAWYGYNVDHTIDSSEELTLVTADTKNLKILPGKYKMTFNPEDAVLAVEFIPVAVPDVYKQVTKLSDLTPGSELVLFWEGEVNKEHKQFAMGTIPDSKKYFDVVANPDRDDNGNILVANDSQILIVTLVEGTKEGCFALKAGNKYISNTSSTNGSMSFVDKLAATCDIVASLEILKNNEGEEYESGLFIFQYVANAGSDENYFQCNVSSGSERFSNYKSGTQKNLMVFKKSTAPEVSEDPASLEFDGGFVEEAKEYTLRFGVADDAHVYYTSLERENMTQTEAEAEVEEPTLANATEWDGNPLVFHHAFIVKAFAVEEGKLNSPVKTHFVDEELATAVAAIEVETGVAEYFTLGGVRVAADSVMPGIYVRRQGNKTSKVLVK